MTPDALQALLFAQRTDGALFDQAEAAARLHVSNTQTQRVFPDAAAIDGLAELDTALPNGPGDAGNKLDLLARFGGSAATAMQGGRYFGFVNGGVLPIALAARWLADAWDQNAALGVMSPTASRIEDIAERWLAEVLGLPEGTAAGFVPGSSTAIFSGLAAARWRLYRRAGWDFARDGMINAPRLRIVTGQHTHAAVSKAVVLLGFGSTCVEYVDVDDQGRIVAPNCPVLDDQTILILQAGNVNSGSFDPFSPLIDRAENAGSWVHIDGAFGLWAAASPRFEAMTEGMGRAQSYSVDAHKTLNLPYDSGIVLCTDPDALTGAFQADGAYLVRDGARDGMRYTPEMSRRARGIEIWAALAWLGRAGTAALIELLHDRAVELADALQAEGFEVLNDVVFNQVLIADGARTDAVLARVQASGTCWAGGSTWFDRPVIRLSVCSWATTREDIAATVRAFVDARAAAKAGIPVS